MSKRPPYWFKQIKLDLYCDWGGLFALQENVVFSTMKIGQKISNCDHVQLDQSAILDKSIWTRLFQPLSFWPTFWSIWLVILTSCQSNHWSKWPSLQMIRCRPLVILTFHLWLQRGIIWCHLLLTLSSIVNSSM